MTIDDIKVLIASGESRTLELKIIGQEVTDSTQQEIAQALAGLEPACDFVWSM